jgi:anti-anti-sigma factor
MQAGRILYAEHQGMYVIKLLGDVRLTLCAALDEFLERMFNNPGFKNVVIDLTETDGVDSTTLGILAKLSIEAKNRFNLTPVIYSTNPDITRILFSMGFEEVFIINETFSAENSFGLGELPIKEQTEEETRLKVLEAHRTLVGLNLANEVKFHELLESLESSRLHDHGRGSS